MLLDPGAFSPYDFLVVHRRIDFNLPEVISELVIRYDEGIGLSSIRDAVWVVIVLGRCLNHYTFISHLVQSTNWIWHLRSLSILHPHFSKPLVLAYLLIVEQVLRQETNYFVAILDPILNCYLNALARKVFVFSMSHRNILGVKHN